MRVGPEHADRAQVLAADDDGCHDHRAGRQRLDAVLDPDRHRHPPVDDVADERHDDELLLERVQDVADDLDGVERAGHPRRATDVHVIVAGDLPDRVERAGCTRRRQRRRRSGRSRPTPWSNRRARERGGPTRRRPSRRSSPPAVRRPGSRPSRCRGRPRPSRVGSTARRVGCCGPSRPRSWDRRPPPRSW